MNKMFLLLAVGYALVAAGCNTMSGLGQDMSKLGDKIEQKAEEKK